MNDLEKKKQAATDAEQAYNDMNYNNFKQGNDYKQLENQTRYQGEQAMKDTMGQAAARTGGYANSYAVSAGQQAQNSYMANLENAARALYDNQKQEKLEKMEVANAIYDRDKAQYEAEADKYKNNLYTDLSLMTDEELEKASWANFQNKAGEFGFTEDDFNTAKKIATIDNYEFSDDTKGIAGITKKLIDSSNFSLSEKEQSNFDHIFGDGAYAKTQDIVQILEQDFDEAMIEFEGSGDRIDALDGEVFSKHLEKNINKLSEALPGATFDQLMDIIESEFPLLVDFAYDPERAKQYIGQHYINGEWITPQG